MEFFVRLGVLVFMTSTMLAILMRSARLSLRGGRIYSTLSYRLPYVVLVCGTSLLRPNTGMLHNRMPAD
jgi:hypothetical protein